MKLTVNTAELKRALIASARVAERKSSIPVLSHVRLVATASGLTVSATDYEVHRQQSIPCQGQGEPWALCVELKALKATLPGKVKDSPEVSLEPVEFVVGPLPAPDDPIREVDPPALQITLSSGAQVKLRTLPVEDFPACAEIETAEPAVFDGEEWRSLVNRVFAAIATEESRFQLSGARLEIDGEQARMIATDGDRLHLAESRVKIPGQFDVDDSEEGIIPRKLLHCIKMDAAFKGCKAPDVYVSRTDYHWQVEACGVRYVARVVEGKFPDYRKVINEDVPECRIQTTAGDLLRTLGAVTPVLRNSAPAIRLELDSDLPVFVAKTDQGEAQATLNGKTEMHGELRISTGRRKAKKPAMKALGLNPVYLADIAKILDPSDKIEIRLYDENTQAVIHTTGRDRYVVMPIRL